MLARIQLLIDKLRSILCLNSIDVHTPEGRSKERHRRVILTSLASVAAKGAGLLTTLISIPLTLHYLGSERFGLWMTISSVIVFLGFADLGVGNGLLNAISKAHGREDDYAARQYISSGFVILSIIAGVILSIYFMLSPHVAWHSFFNVKSDKAIHETIPALSVFAVCFALGIPVNIVQRVQLALQQGFISNIWQTVGSLFGLLSVLLVIHFRGGLPWLVFAFAGVPLLVTLVNAATFFSISQPNLRPKFSFVSIGAMREVMHTGLLFLVLQISIAVAFTSDNLIIARLLGPEAVTQYSVTAKMFGVVTMIMSLVLSPLWPAYSEAIARGDNDWVRKTFSRSLKFSMFFSLIISLVLISASPFLLKLWVGPLVNPPLLLMVGLGIWVVLESTGNALAMFLNGAHIIKAQVILASIFAIACIMLRVFLVNRIGITGMPWGTIVSYVFIILIPYSIIIPRILKTTFKV